MTYNIEKQHEKGKLHAIERINALLDKDSFVEIYAEARHNCYEFGMDKKDIPYDGVITGFGTILSSSTRRRTRRGKPHGHLPPLLMCRWACSCVILKRWVSLSAERITRWR